MLRCRINSANEFAPGGPVSSADVGITILGGLAISAAAKSIRSIAKIFAAKSCAPVGATARKILQQGESFDGFGFAGAECFE